MLGNESIPPLNAAAFSLIEVTLLFYLYRYALPGRILPTLFPGTFAGLSSGDKLEWSMRTLSAVQAVAAVCVGLLIINDDACIEHIILGKSHYRILDHYSVVATSYYLYDLYAMWYTHRHRLLESGAAKTRRLSPAQQLWSFLQAKASFVFHHVFVLVAGWLAAATGKGEFFAGCFLLTEASTPFVHWRWQLSKAGLKQSYAYVGLSALLMLSFFCVRVLLIPYLYHLYAAHAHLPLLDAARSIPNVCNISCGILYALSMYWFALMVKGAAQLLRRKELTV